MKISYFNADCQANAYLSCLGGKPLQGVDQYRRTESCEAVVRFYKPCVFTIDIPTAGEIQTALDAANKRQQGEWATWLTTLQETGVVKPNIQPAGPPQPTAPAPGH